MRVFFTVVITLMFASACEASINQESNCSELFLSVAKSGDYIYTSKFKYKSSDFRGSIMFDKKNGVFTISAPQSFNRASTAEEEQMLFLEGVHCLIDKSEIKTEYVRSVVFDFSPKYYLCKAASYYYEQETSLLITNEYIPKSILDPNISHVLEFSNNAGFFYEWKLVLEKHGVEITGVSSEWLETYSFKELTELLSDENDSAYCSFVEKETLVDSFEEKALLLPRKLSKLELKVRRKQQ